MDIYFILCATIQYYYILFFKFKFDHWVLLNLAPVSLDRTHLCGVSLALLCFLTQDAPVLESVMSPRNSDVFY